MSGTHRIIVSPRAEQDLVDIHDYIASGHPDNAARFVGRLIAEFDTLAALPERHPLAPESKRFRELLRHVTVWPYRIVYRIRSDAVEVITVRHGSRRPLRPDR